MGKLLTGFDMIVWICNPGFNRWDHDEHVQYDGSLYGRASIVEYTNLGVF